MDLIESEGDIGAAITQQEIRAIVARMLEPGAGMQIRYNGDTLELSISDGAVATAKAEIAALEARVAKLEMGNG